MRNQNSKNGTHDNDPNVNAAVPPGSNGAPKAAPLGRMSANAPADDVKVESRPQKKKRPKKMQAKNGTSATVCESIPDAPKIHSAPLSVTPELLATAPEESAIQAPESEAAPEQSTSPVDESTEGAAEILRLRMKIWSDPVTGQRYLMTSAFMRDVVDGRPVSDVMIAYAMRDDDTKLVTLRAAEWNTLPFYYFQEDGPAPRATRRPVDVVG